MAPRVGMKKDWRKVSGSEDVADWPKPQNWRDAGPTVCAFLMARFADDEKKENAAFAEVAQRWPAAESESRLGLAIIDLARGDPEPLIAHLRCDDSFTLSPVFRGPLAKALTDRNWEPGPGRPPDVNVRFAHELAQEIFKFWKWLNKDLGFSDWGVRGRMRNDACEYAIEMLDHRTKLNKPDFEAVRQLMDRDKKRRTLSPRKKPPKMKRVSA